MYKIKFIERLESEKKPKNSSRAFPRVSAALKFFFSLIKLCFLRFALFTHPPHSSTEIFLFFARFFLLLWRIDRCGYIL